MSATLNRAGDPRDLGDSVGEEDCPPLPGGEFWRIEWPAPRPRGLGAAPASRAPGVGSRIPGGPRTRRDHPTLTHGKPGRTLIINDALRGAGKRAILSWPSARRAHHPWKSTFSPDAAARTPVSATPVCPRICRRGTGIAGCTTSADSKPRQMSDETRRFPLCKLEDP